MKPLESSLAKELKILNSFFDKTISIDALVDFVRTIDYVYILPYPDKKKWDLFMNYGFPIILNKAFQKLDLNIDSIPLKYAGQHQIDYWLESQQLILIIILLKLISKLVWLKDMSFRK
jgi:hypothetical protein